MLKTIFKVRDVFKIGKGDRAQAVLTGYPESPETSYVFEGDRIQGDYLRFFSFTERDPAISDKEMEDKAFGRGDVIHIAGIRKITGIDVAPRMAPDSPPTICVIIEATEAEFEKIFGPNQHNIEGRSFEIHG
jgi:hypothetical protein